VFKILGGGYQDCLLWQQRDMRGDDPPSLNHRTHTWLCLPRTRPLGVSRSNSNVMLPKSAQS